LATPVKSAALLFYEEFNGAGGNPRKKEVQGSEVQRSGLKKAEQNKYKVWSDLKFL
jgi:hypothetical protein